MGFVDTHAHLLPFWDDGADSWETSLAMLRMGEQDGIDTVVCTPHILSPRDFDQESELWERYEELVHRAKQDGLALKIHMGAELFVNPELDLSKKIATPAQNGRYYLVEFPMSMMPDFVTKSFFNKIQTEQKIPIIAHPERYVRIIQNPQEAFTYVQQGGYLQVNAGSLLGVFGGTVKEVALRLLRANLVHLVASDAHDLKSRPLRLQAAYDVVTQELGEEKANRLFSENPRRVLQGLDLIKEYPQPVAPPEKRSFWRSLGSSKN